jgi:sortase A
MTTMGHWSEDDAETRMIPVVPVRPDPRAETEVIPRVPTRPSHRGGSSDLGTYPGHPSHADSPASPGDAETTVIPAVKPERWPVGNPVPPPMDDATAVIPAMRPVRTPAGADKPLEDDEASEVHSRTRAYDSEPGAPGYRGKHSDLVPLTDGSPIRTTIRTIGEIMITMGLVLLLFAAYEIWGKAAIVSSHQSDLDAQLAEQWGADPTVAPALPDPGASVSVSPTGPPPPPPGGSLGRLYIPRLDKYWVVVEGVGDNDLAYAPGHYPNTAQPGELGNFSIAGHRSPAIFWDLDRMRSEDPIVMETRNTFYIYRVTSVSVVSPTAVEVVAPVPGQPGVSPTQAMLTITTCNPKWDNYERLIVHAELRRSQPRSDGRPIELQE